MRTSSQRTKTLTITEAAVLSLLAIEGESSGYDLLRQARKSIGQHLGAREDAALRRAAAARRGRPGDAAGGRAGAPPRQAALPDHARGPGGAPALARRPRTTPTGARSSSGSSSAGSPTTTASSATSSASASATPRSSSGCARSSRPTRARPRRLPLVPARAGDRGVRAADPLGRARLESLGELARVRLRLVVAAAAGGAAPHPRRAVRRRRRTRRSPAAGAGRSPPTLASFSVQILRRRVTVTLPAGHPAPTRVAAHARPRRAACTSPCRAGRRRSSSTAACAAVRLRGHGDAGWAPRDLRAAAWQAARDRQPRRLPARLRRPAVRHACRPASGCSSTTTAQRIHGLFAAAARAGTSAPASGLARL